MKLFIVLKSQIGSKDFLESPFLANFHEILIFESQNLIVKSILTCLASYLLQMLKEKLERSTKKVGKNYIWVVARTIVHNWQT